MPGKSRKERKSVKVQKASKNNTRKNKVQKKNMKNMKKQTKNMKKQQGKSMKKLLKKQMKKTLKGGSNSRKRKSENTNKTGKRRKIGNNHNGNNGNNNLSHQPPQPPPQPPLQPQPQQVAPPVAPSLQPVAPPQQVPPLKLATNNSVEPISVIINGTNTVIAGDLMRNVETAIRSGYVLTPVPDVIEIMIRAINHPDFINMVAGCLTFIQREFNAQEIADYIVFNIDPDSVYSPLPEVFYNDVLIRDLFNERLRANGERLDRNPMLQRIEQAIIGEGIVVEFEPRPESPRGVTIPPRPGASTELTPEYTELMEQIDEIIKSQNEAGGEDLITDVQLFGKNVLLSLKRLRLQCKQVVRNLPETVATIAENSYLYTCQQIADSKTLKDVIDALKAVDARRFGVATRREVRLQSLLRLGVGVIGYVQRTITRGVVAPMNSMAKAVGNGIRAANEQLEQERRIEMAQQVSLERIKDYIRSVLKNKGLARNCIELHILSLNDRLNLGGAKSRQSGEARTLGMQGRSLSAPSGSSSKGYSKIYDEKNINRIATILTEEYDIISLLNDLIIAARNEQPQLLMTANINYYNKLLEILGIGRMGQVQPLAINSGIMSGVDENTFAFIMTSTKLGNKLKQLQISFLAVLNTLRLLSSPTAIMPSNIGAINNYLHTTILEIIDIINGVNFINRGGLRERFKQNIIKNLVDMLRTTRNAMQSDSVPRATPTSAEGVSPQVAESVQQVTRLDNDSDILTRAAHRLIQLLQIFIDGRHTVGIPRGTVVNANAFAVPEQPTHTPPGSSSHSSASASSSSHGSASAPNTPNVLLGSITVLSMIEALELLVPDYRETESTSGQSAENNGTN